MKKAERKAAWGGRRSNQTGRPPLPADAKRIRRPIGFDPANLDWLQAESHRSGESMADIVNALINRTRGVK